MLRTSVSLLLAAICLSCDGPAIRPSESLVGAETLPTRGALSREIIYINQGGDAYGVHPHFLSYELRPDDTLVVTYTINEHHTARESIRGRETFHLSPAVGHQARRMLWRVRPQKLEWEQEARPTGCKRRGPHDFGEKTVAFLDEGVKSGIDDDQLGAFELPYPDSCQTRHAVEARTLVRRVLQLFPSSAVAAEYERSRASAFHPFRTVAA